MGETPTEGSDVDPLAAGLAKMVGAAGVEGAKEGGRLLSRVLGPSADELGEALRRYTAFRLENVGRIVKKADTKGQGGGMPGEVPPRVAHRLLEEGSYCDDELMAEYLGGVLAASRTSRGRDDRAVVWSDIVTGMSTLQLRAHFLLYREWAARLGGRGDLSLNDTPDRVKCQIYIDLLEFVSALTQGDDVPLDQAINHAISGLTRLGLIADYYAFGPKDQIQLPNSPFDLVLSVQMSVAGIELYGWAQGLSGMTPNRFSAMAKVYAEEEVPRLVNVALPDLPAAAEGDPEPPD